jgi:hypothetical protein
MTSAALHAVPGRRGSANVTWGSLRCRIAEMVEARDTDLFRTMSPAADGLPQVRRSARALGVRVPDDINPRDGIVEPGTGGMSVAASSVWNLPHHRRPRDMLRGSTGPAHDWVFSIPTAAVVEESLAVRPDPARPGKHAFVEPARPATLAEFEEGLARTRVRWGKAWP